MSYSISTSNHNFWALQQLWAMLCLILFLHQTTTAQVIGLHSPPLCLILFLHQTTTFGHCNSYGPSLCLILFLHQTTTIFIGLIFECCCVLFYFYIKPQLEVTIDNFSSSCVLFYFYIKPQRLGFCLMVSKKLHRFCDEQNGY